MNFKGLAIQTDVLCASGTTTAYFPPDALVSCTAVLSPTEPETLSFAIPRTDARLSEVIVGRVVRTRFTDSTDDVEWDIVAIDDSSRSNVVQVTALPILMRLARCIVNTTSLSDGSVTFDYTGVDLQASEWLDELIFPATTAAGLTWITAGTIDSTRRFGIAGEWSSALEVLAAIAAPGSASCEYRLRRNGNTGYYLDLVTQIGSSAATVRVRPQVNLLETARQRNAVDIATRLYPRGSTSSVSTRTMANHIWQVDSVVSGTVLQLRDVNSGVGPIAYDDQLNGLWLAPMNSTTFSSQEVTDSVASNQRVTISNTTGIVAGDWVRFFHEAGSTAQRVTSVTHPTLVKPPTQGGIGDRGQILDRPNIVADTNLAKNPTMVNWTVSADPPNTWSEYAATPANVSFDKESTDIVIHGTNTWRIRTTGTSSGARGEPLIIPPDGVFSGALVLTQQPGVRVETGDISVWKLATARHTATVWLKVADCPPPVGYDNARVYMYLRDVSRPDFATKPIHPSLQAGLIGTWDYDEGSERGTWLRFQSAPFDLSTFVDFGVSTLNQYHNDIDKVNGKVRVCIELAGGNTGSSTITDKYLYPNYLGTWSSVATYSTNDVVLHVVSGVTRYFIALTTSNNKQPENHLGTNWAEIDGGTGTQQYAGQNVASGWDVYVGPVTVAESTEPIGDREYSGGTELWQSANAALPSRSAVARGYDLRVADLARDDGTTYGDYEFVPGGTIEVINPELDNDVASLRLVEYRPNYLQPLQSEVRVGLPPERLTDLTGQYTDAGTTAAPTTTGAGTVVSGGGTFSLPDTGVVPGTYGSATQSAQIIVDAKGRLTSAANVTIVAGTAAALTPGATINGQLFTGASNITITAGTPQALTAGNYLVSGGTFDGTNPRTFDVDATDANTASKVVARDASGNFAAGTITAALQGNAATATALQTARNINGVSFNGTADITVTAAAGTLTGNTLASGVTASSLTSVGTIGTGIWQGTSVGKNYGGTGLTSSAFTGVTNERVFAYDGGSGTFFVAPSGSNGQALIYSGGALAWGNPAPGSHVLADTTGLGAEHTVSGLTSGMILQATGATTARFQTPSIPASSVTAGTFSGVSYTITNDLTVSGTLTGSLTGNASTATTLQTARNINGVSFNGSADITVTAAAGTLTGSTLAAGVTASSLTSVGTLTNLTVTNPISGSITGNAATVTNGVYTTGSYADPSWITSLAGSKITGNISGSAANVTGTVAIVNGGTNTTNYFVSGSGTRAIVYDVVSNAFEAVAPGTSGQFLQSAGSTGDIVWATPPNFTSSAAGYAPASGGGTSNFLRADGTWAVPAVGSVSANNVTAGTFSGANYFFTNNVRFDSGARVAFGYGYTIDNAGGTPLSVLTATTLGSGVINSSLTSVGTLTSGALGAGFTAIDNARLANSSITINGTAVSLGGSITVDTSKWTSSGSNIYFNTGNVAIGTTPSASIELLVRGGGTTASTYSLFTENSAATSTFSVADNGNVAIPNGTLGIGTSPTTNRLTVNGTTTTTALGVNTSSPDTNLQVNNHIHVGNATTWSNPGGWNATTTLDGVYHGRYRILGSAFASGKNSQTESYFWVDNTYAPYSGIDSGAGFRINVTSGYHAYITGGNLSIGTTVAPVYPLDVNGSARLWNSGASALLYLDKGGGSAYEAGLYFQTAGSNRWEIYTRASNDTLNFYNFGTGASTLTLEYANGNVGVNIISPEDKLHVVGNLRLGNSSNANITFDTASNWLYYLQATGDDFFWRDAENVNFYASYYNGGSTGKYASILGILNVRNNGRVGIGTTSPTAGFVLDAIGNIRSTGEIRSTHYATSTGYLALTSGSSGAMVPMLYGVSESSGVGNYYIVNRAANQSTLTGYSAGAFRITSDFSLTSGLLLNLENYYSSRFVVDYNGNTTIGTSSTPERLYVYSNTDARQKIRIVNDSTGSSARAELVVNAYGNSWGIGMGSSANNSNAFYIREDSNGADTPRLTILTGGNVGIGTTSPEARLDVDVGAPTNAVGIYLDTDGSGGAAGIGVGSSVGPYLVGNTKPDGTVRGAYGASRMAFNAGGFSFDYSSTTSGARVWTSYAVLNSSGNVGIGTTSPNNILHVRSSSPYIRMERAGGANTYVGSDSIGMYVGSGEAVPIYFNTNNTERMRIHPTNAWVGIGVSNPDVALSVNGVVHVGNGGNYFYMGGTAGSVGSWGSRHSTSSGNHTINANSFRFDNVGYGGTWAVEFTSGGRTLIGAATGWASSRLQVGTTSTSEPAAEFNGTGNTAGLSPVYIWNNVESGSTYFISFYSDGQNNARTLRGYINYRRDNTTMNLTTASDYRIKIVHGPYTKSGDIFDGMKVHEATVKGESGKYPMVLAHELQEVYPSAVDGEKDAINEDGTPKLQMVSYTAMIPLMLAEIKSLRARVAALES